MNNHKRVSTKSNFFMERRVGLNDIGYHIALHKFFFPFFIYKPEKFRDNLKVKYWPWMAKYWLLDSEVLAQDG